MAFTELDKSPTEAEQKEIDKLIDKSIRKIKASTENELCRYLPGPSGGYMHHFTMKKMKIATPEKLSELLNRFILSNDYPQTLDPKQRAPRGSKKGKKEYMSFTMGDIEKVLDLARRVGDKDLVARFSPKRSLNSIKKDLVRSIREEQVNQDLWNAYIKATTVGVGCESECNE